MKPTAEQVLQLLMYDPSTGLFTWIVNRKKVRPGDLAGKTDSEGYRVIGINRRSYKAHRLAWLVTHGHWPSGEIDHINGNRSDNRIENLRDVDRARNAQNQTRLVKPGTASGLLGVTWHKPKNCWRASIRINGRSTFIGYFKTAEAGHAAYLEAKKQREVPGARLAKKDRLTIK